jgi:hypothetical protein
MYPAKKDRVQGSKYFCRYLQKKNDCFEANISTISHFEETYKCFDSSNFYCCRNTTHFLRKLLRQAPRISEGLMPAV